jgi:hypothetical protein
MEVHIPHYTHKKKALQWYGYTVTRGNRTKPVDTKWKTWKWGGVRMGKAKQEDYIPHRAAKS